MGALTTLAAVKLDMGLAETETSDDALLVQLINQASDDLESRCNRPLTRESRIDELHICNGGKSLQLELYPVREVASVSVDGIAVTDYRLQASAGILDRDLGWSGEVKVTYTGGYLLEPIAGPPEIARDLPYNLERACILWVKAAFYSRGSEHLRSETVGPLKSDFRDELPAVENVVKQYRRINA